MRAKTFQALCLMLGMCLFAAFLPTTGQAEKIGFSPDSEITRLQGAGPLQILLGQGGSELVDSRQAFRFSPDSSGAWLIYTTDNVNCDPRLILQDALGNEIAQDDDSGGDNNACIDINLHAGASYIILTDFFDDVGSFTLVVKPYLTASLPGSGGQATVNEATIFEFTPTSSGKWGFTTSNNEGDPQLFIFNQFDELIGQDDDSAGELNANLMVNLEAGATYKLQATSFGQQLPYLLNAAPINAAVMPGNGGELAISNATYVQFLPATSGRWEFVTSNNAEFDPNLSLYDQFGNVIASDDDGAGDLNARLSVILAQDRQYSLFAGFYNGTQGSFSLSARLMQDERLPEQGGVAIVSQPKYFELVPAVSGRWSISTMNNGDSDPVVQLFDETGVQIGYSDDNGSDLNANLSVQLQAGSKYIIYVDFYTEGTCILSATPISSVALPAAGGTVQVNKQTLFELVPSVSGSWMFFTNLIDSVDPYMSLTDASGNMLQQNDDSNGSLNASFTQYLEEGVSYLLEVDFFGDAGQIDLSALPVKNEILPPDGGTFQVNGPTRFEFTPVSSGVWEFVTSDNTGDPFLTLFDVYETELASDDDGTGSMNARLVYELRAGTTYIIDANFFFPENGSYKLRVGPQSANAAPVSDSKAIKG